MAKQAQIDAVRPVLTALDKEASAVEHVIDVAVANADKATDVVESGLEKVADVVPEALEKGVQVSAAVTRHAVRGIRNPRTTAIIVGVGCVAAGVGIGILAHQLLKKKLEKQYEVRLEAELEEMRQFYLRRNKAGEFATPRSAAEALLAEDAITALEKYRAEDTEDARPSAELVEAIDTALTGTNDPEAAKKNQAVRYDKAIQDSEAAEEIREQVVTIAEATSPEPVVRNVFVNGNPIVDDEWDDEIEESRRNPLYPYVIKHDEFMENTFDHPQHSLTYFKGDDILADDQSDMIDDVESLVGTGSLQNFGHGSRDPNVVYVRNEVREADFEIALSQGKFSEEVLGLRHSDDSTRFRRSPRWGDGE